MNKIKEGLRRLISNKLKDNSNGFDLLFMLLITAQFDVSFRKDILDRIETDIISQKNFSSEYYIRELLKEYVL